MLHVIEIMLMISGKLKGAEMNTTSLLSVHVSHFA